MNGQLWPVAFTRAQVEITSWDNTLKTQSELLLAPLPFLRNSSPCREYLTVFLFRGILETEICGEVLQLRANYLSGIDESLLFLEGRMGGSAGLVSFVRLDGRPLLGTFPTAVSFIRPRCVHPHFSLFNWRCLEGKYKIFIHCVYGKWPVECILDESAHLLVNIL